MIRVLPLILSIMLVAAACGGTSGPSLPTLVTSSADDSLSGVYLVDTTVDPSGIVYESNQRYVQDTLYVMWEDQSGQRVVFTVAPQQVRCLQFTPTRPTDSVRLTAWVGDTVPDLPTYRTVLGFVSGGVWSYAVAMTPISSVWFDPRASASAYPGSPAVQLDRWVVQADGSLTMEANSRASDVQAYAGTARTCQ